MNGWADGIRESWRDAWREILLIVLFGVIGVAAAFLGDVIGPVGMWVIGLAAIAGVIAVLIVYRRRKAREAAADRAATLARLIADAAGEHAATATAAHAAAAERMAESRHMAENDFVVVVQLGTEPQIEAEAEAEPDTAAQPGTALQIRTEPAR